jgi:hypothetical protein
VAGQAYGDHRFGRFDGFVADLREYLFAFDRSHPRRNRCGEERFLIEDSTKPIVNSDYAVTASLKAPVHTTVYRREHR